MRKFKMTVLAAIATLALPLAAHASLSKTAAQVSDPIHVTNYPEQAAAARDPNAAPVVFTTKPQPLEQLNDSTDFYNVNPGGNATGGGSN